MEWLTNRWVAAAASIWIQWSCGSSYTFSIYSPVLKSTQGYDQSALDTVSVFKDIGANFGILSGLLYSAVTPYGPSPTSRSKSKWRSFGGPWLVLAAGAIQCFVGFSFLWAAVVGLIGRPPVAVMCFFAWLASNGQTFLNTRNVITGLGNFSEYSGTIVGIMKVNMQYQFVTQPLPLEGFLRTIFLRSLHLLLPPAFEVLPSLKRLKQRIAAAGRGEYDAVFMSGSIYIFKRIGKKGGYNFQEPLTVAVVGTVHSLYNDLPIPPTFSVHLKHLGGHIEEVFCGNGEEELLLLVEGLLKKHVASHGLHEANALVVNLSILEQQAKFGYGNLALRSCTKFCSTKWPLKVHP